VKPRALAERVRRVLDRLDDRLDHQVLLPGSDAPHIVATVGAYQRAAGELERRVERPHIDAVTVASWLRTLRFMLQTHRRMAELRHAFRPK
jgi:hypothetical protein